MVLQWCKLSNEIVCVKIDILASCGGSVRAFDVGEKTPPLSLEFVSRLNLTTDRLHQTTPIPRV